MLDLPVFRTTAGQSIVRFDVRHLNRMEFKEPEASQIRDDPDMIPSIIRSHNREASWTGLYRGKPVLCFGLRIVSRGVAEAWMLPGKDIQDHAISLGRGGRKIFTHYLDSGVFRRIQIGVEANNDIAFRFARWLGFEVEGIMRKFAADGGDYVLMSRISEHGTKTSRNP